MEGQFFRAPSEEELRDFTPLIKSKKKKSKTVKEKFEEQIGKEVIECTKKGIPFAEKACRFEFHESFKSQAIQSMNEHGYVDMTEIKPVEVKWSRYRDLKNFEVLDDGETYDENLSKKNPGLNIYVKWKKYKFKGYSNVYTVMEEPASAIARARKTEK